MSNILVQILRYVTLKSDVAGILPTVPVNGCPVLDTDIKVGELFLNTADEKLFSCDASGSIFEVGALNGYLTTGSFNSYTSSTETTINNVYASESNYTTTQSFNAFTQSVVITFSTMGSALVTIENEIASMSISESGFVTTSSFNSFTSSYQADSSSWNVAINNVYLSESIYTATSSFNAFTASINGTINNVYVSESNYLLTSSFNAFTSSNTTIINNIYASQSNYETVTNFNNYTASYHPKRVVTIPSSTTFAVNSDVADVIYMNATGSTGTLTISNDTGVSIQDAQSLIIKIKSTNVQNLSFGNNYVQGLVPIPLTTTGTSKTDFYSFFRDGVTSKWCYTAGSLGF